MTGRHTIGNDRARGALRQRELRGLDLWIVMEIDDPPPPCFDLFYFVLV